MDMIQRLSNELTEAARAKINSLRDQLHTRTSTLKLDQDAFPALPSQTLPPRHNSARASQLKRNLAEHHQQRRLKRQEAAARFLQAPSETQGFQYAYLPTKARVPISQIRARLRKLDIQNTRILDIHYPDHHCRLASSMAYPLCNSGRSRPTPSWRPSQTQRSFRPAIHSLARRSSLTLFPIPLPTYILTFFTLLPKGFFSPSFR